MSIAYIAGPEFTLNANITNNCGTRVRAYLIVEKNGQNISLAALQYESSPGEVKFFKEAYSSFGTWTFRVTRVEKLDASAPNLPAPKAATKLTGGFTPSEGRYRFGLSPAEINAALPVPFATPIWLQLPIATEYRSSEVRYIIVDGNHFADLPYKSAYASCGSRRTVFFFTSSGLFRIAVRNFKCVDAANSNQKVAESVGESVANTAYGTMFSKSADGKVFAGISGSDWGTIEWSNAGSPTYEGQD